MLALGRLSLGLTRGAALRLLVRLLVCLDIGFKRRILSFALAFGFVPPPEVLHVGSEVVGPGSLLCGLGNFLDTDLGFVLLGLGVLGVLNAALAVLFLQVLDVLGEFSSSLDPSPPSRPSPPSPAISALPCLHQWLWTSETTPVVALIP